MERKEVQMSETEKTENIFVVSFWSKSEGMIFSLYSKEETLSRMVPEMEAAFGPDGLKDVTLREATESEIEELRKFREDISTGAEVVSAKTLH